MNNAYFNSPDASHKPDCARKCLIIPNWSYELTPSLKWSRWKYLGKLHNLTLDFRCLTVFSTYIITNTNREISIVYRTKIILKINVSVKFVEIAYEVRSNNLVGILSNSNIITGTVYGISGGQAFMFIVSDYFIFIIKIMLFITKICVSKNS